MADGNITVELSTQPAQAELARLRAENSVLTEQVRALWHALAKVLDAGNREAAATMSWQNARENFSSDGYEAKQHERAMLAASEAEREARVLLLTLRDAAKAEAASYAMVAWVEKDGELVWHDRKSATGRNLYVRGA